MPWPRFQFRLRTMLIAVAFLALVAALISQWVRLRQLEGEAQRNAAEAAVARVRLIQVEQGVRAIQAEQAASIQRARLFDQAFAQPAQSPAKSSETQHDDTKPE